MPNYVFKCEKCDHKFELTLLIKDREIPLKKPCPKCKKKKIIRDWGDYASGNGGIMIDSTLSPAKVCGSAWKEVCDRIKNSGQVPKRYHEKLDRSSDFRNSQN
jgi:putative FmdB family regulatory protein